jgi:hypothetical protein
MPDSALVHFLDESHLADDEFPCFVYEGGDTGTCTSHIWQNLFETTSSLSAAVSPSVEVTTVFGGPFDQARYLSSRMAQHAFLAKKTGENGVSTPIVPLYDEGLRAGGRFHATDYNMSSSYQPGPDPTVVYHRAECFKIERRLGGNLSVACMALQRCPIGRTIQDKVIESVDLPRQILQGGSLLGLLRAPSAWELAARDVVGDLLTKQPCHAGKAVCCQAFRIEILSDEMEWHPNAVDWVPLSLRIRTSCAVEHAMVKSPVPAILREKAWWLGFLSPFGTGDIASGNRAEFLSHLHDIASDSAVKTYCEAYFPLRLRAQSQL